MASDRVVVIGAGIGGLTAALDLAARGFAVTVVEAAASSGGKLRQIAIGDARIDAGPTVFTMRWVFEALFDAIGETLSDHLALRPAEVLARHAWAADQRLDLFADLGRSAEAIGDFAGPDDARGFLAFADRARKTYLTLRDSFIDAPRPTPISLAAASGLRGLGDLWRISPFATLWQALETHFRDPRLQQLFGRYATYCGASPFLAPATLMLVAHVEQDGVWLVDGGMQRIAGALAALAQRRGAVFRHECPVERILIARGRAGGVRLRGGEVIAADHVVFNGDVSALGGLLPGAAVPPAMRPAERSLSAVTWAMVARAGAFPLLRHTVFFADDYAAEFDDIFAHDRLPRRPTVYVCAQDRDAADGAAPDGPERLLCLVNAPAAGDRRPFDRSETDPCRQAMLELLTRCGLTLTTGGEPVRTTPADFARMFPGTGGALYGMAAHGWRTSFRRPGSRTKLAGLYLAGGSVHPGPGVPMAALSGRLAAAALSSDRGSIGRSRAVAMPGGMSTR